MKIVVTDRIELTEADLRPTAEQAPALALPSLTRLRLGVLLGQALLIALAAFVAHKNSTGPAISRGCPGRPTGIAAATFGPNSGSSSVPADISVETHPGATQLTRIPCGASSLDKLLVRLISAPLVTA